MGEGPFRDFRGDEKIFANFSKINYSDPLKDTRAKYDASQKGLVATLPQNLGSQNIYITLPKHPWKKVLHECTKTACSCLLRKPV